MEASSSTQQPPPPPATPSHPSLLPSLSPSASTSTSALPEPTPAPLHAHPSYHPHPNGGGAMPPPPQPSFHPSFIGGGGSGGGGGANVFGQVMGGGSGVAAGGDVAGQPGNAKVYASVYSGIPVFEAMIRGISVMRRTSDSWVNATQVLKVAGIPKSARTKILEKEILSGLHEKVQGGYGKYQGTWIPLQRGQELAAQYGVQAYLAPIFEFVPSPSNVAALPMARNGTPDRAGKTPSGALNYNPALMPAPGSSGRMISPFIPQQQPPLPPQFAAQNGEAYGMQHAHPQMYQQQPMYYHQAPRAMEMTPSRSRDGGLAPAADINGMGLPPPSEVYLDQFGQPHHFAAQAPVAYATNGDLQPPPAKRQRSEEGLAVPTQNGGGQEGLQESYDDAMGEEEGVREDDEDSLDELRDAPPLPASFRLATKPLRPKPSAAAARARGKLLALFSASDEVDLRSHFGLSSAEDSALDFDIDMVIDNQGHTALHWASALAKLGVVAQLIELGADIHRGNYAGETPLIRSVLTTNHAEAGTFSKLLESLAPSIRTLDHAYRSVVHHIALIAGVKGRASAARSYMAGILEWVAKEQAQHAQHGHFGAGSGGEGAGVDGGAVSLKSLVDVQDVHGDTALNVAARVGNKGLVRVLLEAGADRARANKLGLKPMDFGVEVEALRISPAEAVVSTLQSEVPRPERQSRDVQKNISALFETISSTFADEMLEKQTKLNAVEASVRVATRALADKRMEVQRAQAAVGEVANSKVRAENLRKALAGLDTMLDWSGRDGASAPPAFKSLPISSPPTVREERDGVDAPLPERGSEGAVVQLRRMAMWEERMVQVLEERVKAMEGESAEKAVRYRRLVSLCTKVPIEQVDGTLDDLTAAIQSDGAGIDQGRVQGLLSRIKEQGQ